MENFGIRRRTEDEAILIRYGNKNYRNKTWLHKKYWKQGYGMKTLAALCNVNRTTIRYWLRKHNIRTRNPIEAYNLQWHMPTKSYDSFFNRFSLLAKGIVRHFKNIFEQISTWKKINS